MENIQDLSFGKMSLVPFPQTKVKTSGQSLKKSVKSKTKAFLFLNLKSGQKQEVLWQMQEAPVADFLSHIEPSMLSIGEYPNEENVSILSQILQVGVPGKYYLSPRACLGILRRASARGKELPPMLKIALEKQAQSA